MSTTPSAIRDAVDEAPHRVLQRLIMPLSPTPDVIPLYLAAHAARSARRATVRATCRYAPA